MLEHFGEEIPKQSNIWLQITMIETKIPQTIYENDEFIRIKSIKLHESISCIQKTPIIDNAIRNQMNSTQNDSKFNDNEEDVSPFKRSIFN